MALRRSSAVDLPAMVVIGAAFGAVIQVLVKGLMLPLIGDVGNVPAGSEQTVGIDGGLARERSG